MTEIIKITVFYAIAEPMADIVEDWLDEEKLEPGWRPVYELGISIWEPINALLQPFSETAATALRNELRND